LFGQTNQKTNTPSAYFSHKQTKPLAWLAVRTGLFGGGGQQLVCLPQNYLGLGFLSRGLFSTRAESKYQRARADLLTHFLPASADANAAVDWLFF
jgi:hypothetical protein